MFARVIVEGGKEVWGVERAFPRGSFFIRFNGGRYLFINTAPDTWVLERQVYRVGRLTDDVTFPKKTFYSIKSLQLELERLLSKEVK